MLHHVIFLIFLLPLTVSSQLSRNVTLGSSLTAKNGNNYWNSPSGEFAFGFIQPGTNGGYLLAIWFNKIPEKTVVWSANRNNLAPQGSRLDLFQDGRFILSDPKGQSIWDANTGGAGVAYGAMLDTGSFVLSSNNASVTLWQSSDTLTDTLLPSQKMSVDDVLVSSLSESNYSNGRFELTLQKDGNFVLYTRNYPQDATNSPYWATRTFGNDFQVAFNQSGSVSVFAPNGTLLSSVFSGVLSSNHLYQRMTLDFDGVLRHYVYPKSSDFSDGRPMAWSILEFLPPNICLSVSQDTGGGVCGFNSLCSLGSDQKPACQCPHGYSLIDPNDWMGGCKADFLPQSCDNNLTEAGDFGYFDMPNADWPLSDFESFQQVNEDWCRQVCLDDCFCAVAIFRGTNCWKKKNPLSNGRIDSSVGGKALIKIRHTESTVSPGGSKTKNKVNLVVIIVGSVLLGISVIVNILLFLATFFFGHRSSKKYGNFLLHDSVPPGLNIRSFTYNELEEATNGFKEELGKGACSVVYKGTLKYEGMKIVAVKKLHNMAMEGEQEFNAEVRSISRTNHKNLVQLLGYCNEGQHRLLVYEYMSNGSLASYLFVSPRPNWYKRVQIASTTARGLCYLHEECSSQIIHCDIKPQNVLLDESMSAKISDFGLAKLLKQDQTKTMTGIRGTRGYVAPEWFRSMPITTKVDVYSFGILLLELVCCRKNIELDVEDEKEVILSDWAYDCHDEGKIHLLIVDDEEAQDDFKRVEKFVSIGLWCIQEDPSLRPNMKRVVQMLEGSVLVSVPPNPSSFISSIS